MVCWGLLSQCRTIQLYVLLERPWPRKIVRGGHDWSKCTLSEPYSAIDCEYSSVNRILELPCFVKVNNRLWGRLGLEHESFSRQ